MAEDWSVVLRPTVKVILQKLLDGPRSLSELSRETRLTKPALQRHLKDLERLGVVASAYRPVGMSREVVYHHAGCSLHLEIRPSDASDPLSGAILSWASPGPSDAAFPWTAQVPDPKDRAQLVALFQHLKRAVPGPWSELFIVLFGSVAKGEATAKSDIDLLVVLPREDKAKRERIADAFAEAQQGVERPLQPFFTVREAFLSGRRRMDAVAAEEGLVVHGDPSERELWSRMTRYKSIWI